MCLDYFTSVRTNPVRLRRLDKLKHCVFECTRTSRVSMNCESTADRVMIFVRMSVLYYIQGIYRDVLSVN